jgi:hypothetical protein
MQVVPTPIYGNKLQYVLATVQLLKIIIQDLLFYFVLIFYSFGFLFFALHFALHCHHELLLLLFFSSNKQHLRRLHPYHILYLDFLRCTTVSCPP